MLAPAAYNFLGSKQTHHKMMFVTSALRTFSGNVCTAGSIPALNLPTHLKLPPQKEKTGFVQRVSLVAEKKYASSSFVFDE